MVWNKNVHATNIVFNSGGTTIFNSIHDAVDHDLGSKGIVAGHCNHASLDGLTAGSIAICICAAAFGTGAVV